MFGDSHAAHWFPAFEKIAQERKWKLVTFLKFACPTADVPVYNPRLGRVETECAQWRNDAVKQIVALHPNLIVVGNSSSYVNTPTGPRDMALQPRRNGKKAPAATVAAFDGAGLRTVVFHDVPLPRMDVPVCLSRAVAHRWYREIWCDSPRTDALDPDVLRAEQEAVTGLRAVSVVDFSDVFCDASTCKVEVEGEPIYRDQDHLDATFSRSLAPMLSSKLSGLVHPEPIATR